MWLKGLHLENFCNYGYVDLELDPGINVVWGENAQGKSNLIDAIHYLCFLRGVRGLPDDGVVKFGAGGFLIAGAFVFSSGVVKECRVAYDRQGGKVCLIGRKRIGRRSELIGQFPIVAMSSEDYRLTRGTPGDRRRFLDVMLSQLSAWYLENLRAYTATLRQRNTLLRAGPLKGSEKHLGTWTEQLVEYGCQLMTSRSEFIAKLRALVAAEFTDITDDGRALDLEYVPSVPILEGRSLQESFFWGLQRLAERERVMGVTLLGPHRDDLAFKIEHRDLRNYGSRGDHKAVLIALRLAEHKLIQEVRGESPVLLLDDLLVDLDRRRAERLGTVLPSQTQIVATSTDPEAWRVMGLRPGSFREFRVYGGTVQEVS